MENFNFINLDSSTRTKMLQEVEYDKNNGLLFFSSRFNPTGRQNYEGVLIDAIKTGDETTLINKLSTGNYFNTTEQRNGKSAKVPINAAQLLAQSEFNRFYIRALCIIAIELKIDSVEIYRARISSSLRPESQKKIGQKLDPRDLLEDLRASIGAEPKILPEINSGLSIKL